MPGLQTRDIIQREQDSLDWMVRVEIPTQLPRRSHIIGESQTGIYAYDLTELQAYGSALKEVSAYLADLLQKGGEDADAIRSTFLRESEQAYNRTSIADYCPFDST